MRHETAPPTGLARRGVRLSDEETARRMLGTAVAMVRRAGLTVSLEHMAMEDIIREARVARSAAYRRWPYKDLFLSDLVRELAREAPDGLVAEELSMLRAIAASRLGRLDTAEARQALVLELVRELAVLDFESIAGSTQWRTYLGLHATLLSLPEGDLRRDVQAALARSEEAHAASVARAWSLVCGLLGFRLRPDLDATFATLAALVMATLRGLALTAVALPAMGQLRLAAAPPGAEAPAPWSLPGLAVASLVSTFLEPDPEVVWDERRAGELRMALARLGRGDS